MTRNHVEHNHIYQAESAAEAVMYATGDQRCPACRLVRPSVMEKAAMRFLRLIDLPPHFFGGVPQP